jgi:hypothetical protein
VRETTKGLLAQGFLANEADPAIRVGEPLPVMEPDRSRQHSWFVPLEVGPKLVGFAELTNSLTPVRVSSFQRQPRVYEDCPALADWIDPDRIRARAATLVQGDEQLSPPFLTYDGDPSRLAWKIEAKSSSGATRVLFVTGATAYPGGRGQGLV